MTGSTIAARVLWLAVFVFVSVAVGGSSGRLFALFSMGSLFAGAAVVVCAFKTGNEWPRGKEGQVGAAPEMARKPSVRVGWSWIRLAYAFEVISVGLLMWLVAALVVGGPVYLASGFGISWIAVLLVVGITSPVAVPWPLKRWPPPMASAFTRVPALLKRRLVVTVFSAPGVLVVAVTIDRLVSSSSTLSPARWLASVGVIVLVVATTVWVGRYLPPSPTLTDEVTGLVGLRRQAEPIGPYGANHRYARAISSFEVVCAGAVIVLITLALMEPLGASFENEDEAFFVVLTARWIGILVAVAWISWRLPLPNDPNMETG